MSSPHEADVTDRVYNVASGTEVSLRGWPRRCCGRWAPTSTIEYGPERAVNGVTRRLADT